MHNSISSYRRVSNGNEKSMIEWNPRSQNGSIETVDTAFHAEQNWRRSG